MESRGQHRKKLALQRVRQDLHAPPSERSAAADFFVLPDLMRKFIHHLVDALFRLFHIYLKSEWLEHFTLNGTKSEVDNVGSVKFQDIICIRSCLVKFHKLSLSTESQQEEKYQFVIF